MAGFNANGTLKGRVAVVTGASRGIGEAIAVRLAMEGAKVVASARTAEPGESKLPGTLHATVDRIRAFGGEAMAVKADLSDEADRVRLIDEAVAAYGPVDILVNDAAVTFFIPVETFPKKRFDLMMEVQVWAPFHLSQLVLPSMRERKQGWIVNISSGAGIHPKQPYNRRGGGTVYGMCKAALERFTTGLASEVYDDNIAVNVVSPGLVDTPGVAVHGLINEQTKDRVQPIEYIAEAVYQLCKGDPKTMTGRIDYAAPFLEELNLKPSELA
ncbi:MAG: SDR family NAD(P)-dependent oxidoreductase [Phenylobacterium sp.]|uniref:SDR family NAD(P)-dependent oxidoreductase n=1 Tax=Phenylobacterium sp. TaxID=1871053 RepID=UPI001A5A1648|nr:SDR family NAD(P)-dependent oxidoreductase [Phenylobacterium sp.]MBL8770762.1 SDR family NAD(P)-dependent oxidoreductase [Phenylobacterium sp.]